MNIINFQPETKLDLANAYHLAKKAIECRLDEHEDHRTDCKKFMPQQTIEDKDQSQSKRNEEMR